MYTSDKTQSMRIRMTPAQHAHVCAMASITGMTASAYIRSLITRDSVARSGGAYENESAL